MSIAEYVSEALTPFSTYEEHHGAVPVTTSCLYPSNALVTVFVRGGPTGAVVSDDGQAIDELTAVNLDIPDADRFLYRFCRQSGMKAEKGVIFSPRIEWRQLPAAIAFVANTAATAVTAGLQSLKTRRGRDFHKELDNVLLRSFPKDRIKRKFRVVGQSARPYTFDIVHVDSNILIVDSVVPDSNSIHSRATAHFDVGRRQDDSIIQHLVYDDEENWKAADLNLLQTVTTIVPLSQAEPVMREYAKEYVGRT